MARAKTIPAPLALLARVWPPMLASLVDPGDVGTQYDLIERKYDGYRALAGLVDGSVALQSRNALDLSVRFPAVAEALRDVPGELVLDGELVARGPKEFSSLQAGSADIDYVIFDLLWANGEDLRGEPLSVRREMLERALANFIGARSRLQLAARMPGPVKKAMQQAKKLKLEGVVCKRSDSPYSAGRQRAWVKCKVLQSDEFAVIGFVPLSTGAPQIGSLLLATTGAKPRFAGKVGTGFSTKTRAALYSLLQSQAGERPKLAGLPTARDIVWTRPAQVVEVAYSEVTPDGKLRHPSFQRLREDKSA